MMEFHFDPGLVLLSIIVAVLASYTALNLSGSVWDARNERSRSFWLMGGSLAMGFGIWSMHFIGMLAFSMPGMDMAYDRFLVVVSILVAIGASGLALHVVSDPRQKKPAYLVSGVVMGGAIAGMHYLGMASMRMAAVIEWNYFLVFISVLIAVIASIGALYTAFFLRAERDKRSQIGRMAGALFMGFAIAGMHYTGMYAAHFVQRPNDLNGFLPLDGLIASANLTFLVTATTLGVLAIALTGSIFDQALRKRTMQAKESDRLFQQAKKALSDLREERELRERFVSSLTHDLRTPITAAHLNAQLMARVISEPARILRLNAKILENLNRVDEMIGDLLDAHRISADQKLPLLLSEVDLATVVRRTTDDLKTIHGDRFQLSIPEALRGNWDEKYVKRVIENLCTNGVKYGQAHAPIAVSLHSDSKNAYLSVQNQGQPLTEEEQSRLFHLFHRSQQARVSGVQGWGIGLTLVKGVAESHGGNVQVSSDESRGTVFTVVLPLQTDQST